MTLKEFRKSLGFTQQQAGETIGVSKQSWYQLETNWPNVNASSIWDIAEKMGAVIKITPSSFEIIGLAEEE
ncbi:MAG: helix-turn-helix transcriptional regulator [Bacteroidota bacterium]